MPFASDKPMGHLTWCRKEGTNPALEDGLTSLAKGKELEDTAHPLGRNICMSPGTNPKLGKVGEAGMGTTSRLQGESSSGDIMHNLVTVVNGTVLRS